MKDANVELEQQAETIAAAFHEAYERLAPSHGYVTRTESAVPWPDVPAENRSLMVAVVKELLADTIVYQGAWLPEQVIAMDSAYRERLARQAEIIGRLMRALDDAKEKLEEARAHAAEVKG